MSEERKRWIVLIAASLLLAGGLVALNYFQRERIDERRAEAESLRRTIADDRALIEQTPDLVKQVIVQRETDVVIKQLLSDEEDINNLVRTLRQFEEGSEITITSLKKQRDNRNRRGRVQDFDRVGYTLTFQADAFQFMSFVDRVETHSRFMSVTAFKLQAASRQNYDREGGPRHKVTLDLETYVYTPTGTAEHVRIDHYDRKRDLLISEISQRGAELRITSYTYHGQAGRRDPWVDPRIQSEGSGAGLTIQEQFALVDELIAKAEEAEQLAEDLSEAPNVIAEMKARAQLEERIAFLESEIMRVRAENLLLFVPASRRFDQRVVDVVERLGGVLQIELRGQGPSVAVLRETAEAMDRHIRNQQYELAIEIFEAIKPRLALAEKEELKRTWVQTLVELTALAQTVIEFEAIELNIGGIAIYEDHRPVALINGQAVAEGELIGQELIVRNIGPEQIEFAFRGLILARIVETGPPE